MMLVSLLWTILLSVEVFVLYDQSDTAQSEWLFALRIEGIRLTVARRKFCRGAHLYQRTHCYPTASSVSLCT